MAERLDVDEPEDLAEELERALAEDAGVAVRPVTEGEVSVHKWAEGDPARAMAIADSLGERRGRALFKFRLVQAVYRAKLAVLNAWLADYGAKAAKEVDWVDGMLDLFQQDFCADERTTRLPSVTLKRRKRRHTHEWVDEDEALRYQEEIAPDDVTHKLNKSALLKRLRAPEGDAPDTPGVGEYVDEETGEVVGFLRAVAPEEPETFSVEQVEEEKGE